MTEKARKEAEELVADTQVKLAGAMKEVINITLDGFKEDLDVILKKHGLLEGK